MDYKLEIFDAQGNHVITKTFFREEIEDWNDGDIPSQAEFDFFFEDEVARKFGVESAYGSNKVGSVYYVYEPSSDVYLGAGILYQTP